MHARIALAVLLVTLAGWTTQLGRAQATRHIGPGETYIPNEQPLPGPRGLVGSGPPNPLGEPARSPAGTHRRYRPDALDLSSWDYWWGTNGPELLESTRASGSARPTPETLTSIVVPALIEASGAAGSPGVRSAALLALAKLGAPFDAVTRAEHLLHGMERLASDSQEVAETAVLALGVLGDERAVPLLAALMHDGPRGRRALRDSAVPMRTRTFAAYALGLIAERDVSNDVRRAIAAHLIGILEEQSDRPFQAPNSLKVGAMDALGLVRLDWPSTTSVPHQGAYAQHVADRCTLLAYVVDYIDPEHETAHAGRRHAFVRAHAPLAVARLLRGHMPRAEVLPPEAAGIYASAVSVLLRMCSEDLEERKESQQSAIIALGLIAAAPDDFGPAAQRAELDAPVWARLLETATNASDRQREFFALIALAEASGRRSGTWPDAVEQSVLQGQLLSLASDARGYKVPWCSLALATFGRAVVANGGTLDGAVVSALRATFKKDKTPQTTGAHALGLAMLEDSGSAADLLRRFERDFLGSPETTGAIAQALGMLGVRDALQPIKATLNHYRERALMQPRDAGRAESYSTFLQRAAPAIGLIGGRDEVPYLIDLLRGSADQWHRGSVAIALGLLGESSAVGPLVALLCDPGASPGARAAAATALGLVCDTAGRPWNASYLLHANHRVNTLCLDDEAGTGLFERL